MFLLYDIGTVWYSVHGVVHCIHIKPNCYQCFVLCMNKQHMVCLSSLYLKFINCLSSLSSNKFIKHTFIKVYVPVICVSSGAVNE